LTNEIPQFVDSSGALASRFIILVLTNSFYGRENPALTDELLAEAPSILNWALEGYDRYRARGYLVVPDASTDAMIALEDLSSPVGAFVRERCRVEPTVEVDKDALYAAWRQFSEDEGRARTSTKAVFMRDLNAAVPGVVTTKLRTDKGRLRTVRGIRLLEPGESAQGSDVPRTTLDQTSDRSSVEPEETSSLRDTVQDGPGSPGLYDRPSCVRCERYGQDHVGPHAPSWTD
jgi:putative DNA primase/helicase